jgi:hypothetical protein
MEFTATNISITPQVEINNNNNNNNINFLMLKKVS